MADSLNKGSLGVTGNNAIQDRLLAYLRGGRIHPGAILSGPDRAVKFLVVRNIAKFLLCPKKTAEIPFCDTCSTCRRIEKDIHPDVYICRADADDVIKIETVREICHQMELSPMEGVAKVCIIDECHRMSSASANAFLKSLEEPGPDRYFWLLTTQMGSLLPTILSRCLKFTFKPEAETEVPPAEETETMQKLFEELLRTKDYSIFLSELDEKERCLQFVRFLQRDLRDAALGSIEQKNQTRYFKDQSPYALLEKFNAALTLEGRLRSNANYALMLEVYLKEHVL